MKQASNNKINRFNSTILYVFFGYDVLIHFSSFNYLFFDFRRENLTLCCVVKILKFVNLVNLVNLVR